MKTKKFHKAGVNLPVRNLRETLDYYRDQLGFYEEWTFGSVDGGLRRDEIRLLFGENAAYVDIINNENNCLNLIWFVEDIEAIYTEYQERGIKIISPLESYDYGMREFAFFDINGYYVRVSEGISGE
jgi:uncharacterized glyoxalase superfamily protein PhnB